MFKLIFSFTQPIYQDMVQISKPPYEILKYDINDNEISIFSKKLKLNVFSIKNLSSSDLFLSEIKAYDKSNNLASTVFHFQSINGIIIFDRYKDADERYIPKIRQNIIMPNEYLAYAKIKPCTLEPRSELKFSVAARREYLNCTE